jgi:hypothetical protein
MSLIPKAPLAEALTMVRKLQEELLIGLAGLLRELGLMPFF